ncbi:MAG TPA: dienelactone hydrolase family protein [Caulobacteraceae bacterium]
MKTSDIEYHVAGVRYVGYLAVDEAREGRRPGVLVAPEGMGLGDLCKAFARRLADLGYVAFAVDYYGDGALTPREEVMERIGRLTADPAPIRVIATAALEVLKAQPQTDPARLAAIGYCFGGTTVLELARSGAEVAAVVGFHSGLGTTRPAEAGAVKARILVQVGADDPLVPADARLAFEKEMTAAGADWRLTLFGGVGHSFTNPEVGALGMPGFAYDKDADERSWRAMLDLFDEAVGPPA